MKRHIQTLRRLRLPPQRNFINEALDRKTRPKIMTRFVETYHQLELVSAK